MRSRALLLLGAVLVFGLLDWGIWSKERLRAGGQVVYLELAPIDPRSLMQGDYMALNFQVARQIGANSSSQDSGPQVAILQLDERSIAHYVRLDSGQPLNHPLNQGEVRFRFRYRNGSVWLGTNAFFFQEGQSERYRGARYGEFRVNPNGDAMLVNLRDIELRLLSATPMPN